MGKKEIKKQMNKLIEIIKLSKWDGTIVIDRSGYFMCDMKLDLTPKFPEEK